MTLDFLAAILFVLPAYVSNSSPVVFGGGSDAMDRGSLAWDKRRWLGKGKTWRGLVAGLLLGTFATLVLSLLPDWYVFGLSASLRMQLGLLLVVGAQLGDLLGSFIKRRLGLADGASALLMDQLLFLFVGLALCAPFFLPPLSELVFLTLLTLVLHPATNALAYLFKLKRVPW